MLLQHAGVTISKMQLAGEVKKDRDHLVKLHEGDVVRWGNPNHGFVGDITGKSRGYAVYVKPMQDLLEKHLPGRSVNLTGKPFASIVAQIYRDKPVIIWTTVHFNTPRVWDIWRHGNEQIKGTREEHAVLLVGYDERYLYINDPLTGIKSRKIDKNPLLASWNALGKQALSYR